jgi:hypothetical protein
MRFRQQEGAMDSKTEEAITALVNAMRDDFKAFRADVTEARIKMQAADRQELERMDRLDIMLSRCCTLAEQSCLETMEIHKDVLEIRRSLSGLSDDVREIRRDMSEISLMIERLKGPL